MTTQLYSFQAEIQELLGLVVHSLYTDKEIFVRELISNAADACEKARFTMASGQTLLDADVPCTINLTTDSERNTITFTDTGIGMSHEDLINNLGTIASSGSKKFLQQLKNKELNVSKEQNTAETSEDAQKEKALNLIGQFGVGFYSAFMVADRVEVHTRSATSGETGWKWVSDGKGSYTIEEDADYTQRGTTIIVHLKDEHKDFADESNVKSLVKRYSSFVPFPISMGDDVVNNVKALWAKRKSEISDEEYNEFYQFLSHDYQDPRYRLHWNVDAPIAMQSLLFVPKTNSERFGSRQESEVNLYSRKVLIQAKAKSLLPDWLRFIKGVVDSEEIPLNISRETMQDSALLAKMSRTLTSRVLKWLSEEAKHDETAYQDFFQEFGIALKEGVMTDSSNKDGIAGLLRFESSKTEAGKLTSLTEYVSRAASHSSETYKNKIYYLQAANRTAAENSPYFEAFKAQDIEVLFFYDPRDSFVVEHLDTFSDKEFVSADKAEITVDEDKRNTENEAVEPLTEDETSKLVAWLKDIYGSKVDDVRTSNRLINAPAIAVDASTMTTQMKKILRSVNRDGGMMAGLADKPVLEINPKHPLVVYIHRQQANLAAEYLLEQALLASGMVEDPSATLQRVNQLLAKALK